MFPSVDMVTTCHGIIFPLFLSAVLTASSIPPQQGTSILATATDLSKMNTDNLKFYSVSPDGTVRKIQTTYRVDKNGFVHFSTPRGGDIIITDKTLG